LEIDAAFSYNQRFTNHVKPEFQVPLCTPGCLSKELPQKGIRPVGHPPQPADEKLILQQAEIGDLSQLFSEQGQEPHLIIVVNMLQSSESIILQRRSSYQKILGLENEDLQVESELKLPVDLILNPSTCLTVYTEDKLLRRPKSHNPNSMDFFSCIMGMVVDRHMKALSFSFQRWFLVRFSHIILGPHQSLVLSEVVRKETQFLGIHHLNWFVLSTEQTALVCLTYVV
jgi:hypothetical protein